MFIWILDRLFIVLLSIFFASCNHLFYYPHKDLYVTPDQAKLEYREVRIKSHDPSVDLHGWHIKAASPHQKTVILQLHGNAENRSTHFLSVAWLAHSGFDVLAVDYRGYNGSSGTPSRQGLVDDAVAAIEWMMREFPAERHFVIGQSLGASVAIPAVIRAKARLDGLIIESAFHSYRGIARMKLASIWLTWPFQWLPWVVLSGDMDPIDDAANIRIPVLAFHDREDPVVPLASGMMLYNAIEDRWLDLHILEGRHHVGAFSEGRKHARDLALKFLK